MVAYDERKLPDPHNDYYCVFAGRRDNVDYVYSHQDIMTKYAYALKMWERMPQILSAAMGDQTYIARFRTKEEMDEFLYYVCLRK